MRMCLIYSLFNFSWYFKQYTFDIPPLKFKAFNNSFTKMEAYEISFRNNFLDTCTTTFLQDLCTVVVRPNTQTYFNCEHHLFKEY